MPVVLITGSAGLVGSEAARFLCRARHTVAGVDNDLRSQIFGPDASTRFNRDQLLADYPNYTHHDLDIRDQPGVENLFRKYESDIALILHTAAQPSHDWAAQDPHTDFTVNAGATLLWLDCARRFCPQAVFLFTSTNKVYGDRPNSLPLVEQETRWEIDPAHAYWPGIDESMSIDSTMHSLFGASKVAADILVQEYGRYFGMKTACFRAGCITGPHHAGVELHGFLAYLMKCVVTGSPYTVFGYRGKQVRDNIHSADLVQAFWEFFQNPRPAEVYNIGGSRFSHCSMLEAIALSEEIAGRKLRWSYQDRARVGDHIWWISDVRKFQSHYPDWRLQYNVRDILVEILESNRGRWKA